MTATLTTPTPTAEPAVRTASLSVLGTEIGAVYRDLHAEHGVELHLGRRVDGFVGDPHTLMYAVGAIEIVAGLVVAVRPRFGGYLVAAWLAGIIVNLVLMADFYDIALRDFGLLVGALALARLATAFPVGRR